VCIFLVILTYMYHEAQFREYKVYGCEFTGLEKTMPIIPVAHIAHHTQTLTSHIRTS